MLQQRVQLVDGLPDLALSVAIDGATQNLDTPLVKIHDLLFRGMRAQRLAGDMGELVPHHDGPLTATLVVFVLDRHALNNKRELVDHLVECIVIVSLASGDELVLDLRVDVPSHDHICAMRSLHPVRHGGDLRKVQHKVGLPTHSHG